MSVGVREVGIDIRARDMASSAFQAVGQSMGNIGGSAQEASKHVGALGRIADTVGKGMQIAFGFSVWGQITKGVNFAKDGIIGYNQRLQDSTTAMNALSGDAEGVAKMIKELTTIANNSPFELPGLLASSQMLVGLKFKLSEIPGMMTAIGNTAAATGGANVMEKINTLTQGFVRMQAAGRVTGEVMEVMRNSGVPALDWLAKGFGVTSLEMQKMIAKGIVPADKAMRIMLTAMQTNYGGVAEAQAKTFTGAMSTVKDAGKGLIATMFKPLFEVITKVLYGLGQFIQMKGFTDFANSFAAGMQKVIDTLTAMGDVLRVIRNLADVFKVGGLDALISNVRFQLVKLRTEGLLALAGVSARVMDAIRGISDRFAPLRAILDPLSRSVASLSVLFTSLATSNDRMARISLEGVFRGLGGAIEAAARMLIDFLPKVTEFVLGIRTRLKDMATQAAPAVDEFIRNVVSKFVDALPQMLADLAPMLQKLISGYINAGYDIEIAISKWAMSMIDWIAPVIPKVMAALSGFGQEMFSWFLAFAPQLADKLTAWGSEMVNWISDRAPEAIAALSAYAQSLFDWIINTGVPSAAAAIGPMALKFVDWVFEVLPKLLDALDVLIGAIFSFIINNGPTLVGKLLEWALAFVGWIATEVVPRLIENLPTILRVILLFLGGAVLKIGGKALELGSTFIKNILSHVSTLPGKVVNYLTGPGGVLSKVISFATDFGNRALSAGGGFVKNLLDNIASLPGKLWAKLVTDPDSVMGRLGSFMSEMKTKAINVAGAFIGGLMSTLAGLPGKLWDSVMGAVRSLFRNGFEIGPMRITINGIYFMGQRIGAFAKGAWSVPETMPAIVHKGEMILPASVAEAIRGLGSQPRMRAPQIGATVSPTFVPAMAGTGGTIVNIYNNFGRDSVRSDDDIRKINQGISERALLLGLSVRTMDSQRVGA